MEQLLAGREENDLLALLNEGLARNPEHVEALRLLIRVYWWQRDMDNLRLALERLAEAAEAGGLVEDERYALTQLIRLAPDDRYSERLIALGGSPEDAGVVGSLGSEGESAETPTFDNFEITGQETELADEEVTPVEFEWNSLAEPAPGRSQLLVRRSQRRQRGNRSLRTVRRMMRRQFPSTKPRNVKLCYARNWTVLIST